MGIKRWIMLAMIIPFLAFFGCKSKKQEGGEIIVLGVETEKAQLDNTNYCVERLKEYCNKKNIHFAKIAAMDFQTILAEGILPENESIFRDILADDFRQWNV